jgi:hypothetical protein
MTATLGVQETRCPDPCGAIIAWNVDRCPRCHGDAGAPNVRLVTSGPEKKALNERAADALGQAFVRGVASQVDSFSKTVAKQSVMVINLRADFLHDLLSKSRTLYATYHQTVKGGVRKPASFEDDRRRNGVDAILWGSISSSLSFGALSLDGAGLPSYGPIAVTIADPRCRSSATLLERNSFHFVEQHQLTPAKPIPIGYRASWDDRHFLVVAKLADKITASTSQDAFPKLLLTSAGNRHTDEFVEVFLYGSFDSQAIAKVVQSPGGADAEELQLIKNARDIAGKLNIDWELR